ncbi:MAG: ribonuclease III [Acidobacteria bacterium]|nr:ribonuclease III [Acidobacteriota bacterium]
MEEGQLLEYLKQLSALEKALGYSFRQKTLLRQALTHRSFVNENQDLGLRHNESLEFLGDSVLGFVISTHLFQIFPNSSEGQLSRYRSFLVSGNHLIQLARDLDLGRYLLLGRGETKTLGYEKKSILTDTLEAIIAAMYLDGGLRSARSFIRRIFRKAFRELQEDEMCLHDYKTQLQEYLAETLNQAPRYVTIGEEGPDHDKIFYVQIEVNGELLGRGHGQSKKEAQRMAARETLALLKKQKK